MPYDRAKVQNALRDSGNPVADYMGQRAQQYDSQASRDIGYGLLSGAAAIGLPETAPVMGPASAASFGVAASDMASRGDMAQAQQMWLEHGRRMGWVK